MCMAVCERWIVYVRGLRVCMRVRKYVCECMKECIRGLVVCMTEYDSVCENV